MSKVKLQEILADALALQAPQFQLEKIGTKWSGSVISDTFKGKSDAQRVKMLWDALEAELGAQSVLAVGTLLAYTQDEWNIDLPGAPAKVGKAKKAS